jgi:hypothetical protein
MVHYIQGSGGLRQATYVACLTHADYVDITLFLTGRTILRVFVLTFDIFSLEPTVDVLHCFMSRAESGCYS